MDSPPKANCLIVAPSSSPKLEESPSFHLFSDLSPLKSVKAQPHCLRFIHTNFSIPPPVFSSPRMGEREISIPKSTEMDAAESEVHVQCDSHLKSEIVQNFQKEEQAQSPSFYLVDPTEMEVNTSSSHLCVQQENDMSNILNSSMISRQDTIIRASNITESDMLLGPCFEAQCHEQYVPQMLQAADNHDNKVGDSYQSFPQSLQSAEAYNNSDQSSRQTSIGSFKGADQRHSGVSRHLHFGVTVDSKLTGNEIHDAANSSSPAALPNVETMVPHHVESGGISSNWQAGSHAQTATFLATFCPSPSALSTQDSVHDGSVCIPSGLGFPLSSITRSLSMGSDLTASNLAGNQNAQEERQVCDRNRSSAEDLDSISNSSATRDIYAQLEDYRQESQVTETVGSVNYPIISMQPPCDSLLLTPCEQRLVPYEGRTFTSPNPDTVKELNKASPKRNRKRAKHINDSEVCKSCNCKRSKCLKLYCECFAAGVYCLDSCACENCFNRPEYEDTVLGTREQIETRNPLAFAPKVVKLVTSSPANMVEVGSWTTPSSGRHKRGCNCKKSKCLKKYCECYQAGVGCSTGCRCEGCNNSFGMKPESTYRRAEKWASPSHEQMDNLEAQDDFSKAGRVHQFSSKWEEFPGIGHLTPLSHHLSRPAASSASLNIGGHSKVSQAQVGNLQSSTVHYNSQYSSSNLTPKSPGRKVVSEVNSDGLFCDMLKDDAIPRILKNTSTPSKAVQRSSPNKKRVSPPQIQSQDLRSNSSKELRSSLKLKIPVVPSFPSLTPYSKLKDRDSKIDDDIKVRGRDI